METKDNEGRAATMKRLIIVCEGPTENEFCLELVAPKLLKADIYVEAPLIKKSNGGIVSWPAIKRQLERHLHEGNAYVSLMVDYYGIKDSHGFPGWQESKVIYPMSARWQFLCNRMKTDITSELSSRFIPYIQIHEFESLLFSDIEVFRNNFASNELDFSILEVAIQEFPNPEDINSRPTLAPSKRLIEAIPGYDKIIYGNCLAADIGLDKIMEKCPLFSQWVTSLQNI